MQKQNSIQYYLNILLIIVVTCFSANSEELNSKELLQVIEQKLNGNLTLLNSGTGTALVTTIENGSTNKSWAEFAFDKGKSRSDFYDYNNNLKGERFVVWSDNQRAFLSYNGNNVVVWKRPLQQFNRNIGFDFHPDVFNSILKQPINKLIGNFITAADNINVDFDDQGLCQIKTKCDRPEKNGYELCEITLDTNNNYRLTSYTIETFNLLGKETKSSNKVNLNWCKYGDNWYIESASIVEETKQKGTKNHKEVKLEIKDFLQNTKIKPEHFEIEGLSIPTGTIIVDKIVGITYNYNTMDKFEEQTFLSSLNESKIISRIKNSEKTKNSCQTQDTDNKNTHNINVEEAKKTIGTMPIIKKKQPLVYYVVIIIICLLIILLSVWIYIRKLSK